MSTIGSPMAGRNAPIRGCNDRRETRDISIEAVSVVALFGMLAHFSWAKFQPNLP